MSIYINIKLCNVRKLQLIKLVVSFNYVSESLPDFQIFTTAL